ncbi:hypothetical protein WH95_10830 [Kiloniella litopenaei]|uniref:Uncharacterized protein n=1 Tax=Kiloniella litopenaei TaxID=1549748 RepID=A0A0M2R8V3_9PROT|nr:hypothetical protein WH95_10830 [Kiloniella litopenaei]
MHWGGISSAQKMSKPSVSGGCDHRDKARSAPKQQNSSAFCLCAGMQFTGRTQPSDKIVKEKELLDGYDKLKIRKPICLPEPHQADPFNASANKPCFFPT